MTSYLVGLRCVSCGAPTSDRTRDPVCPACGGFLQAEYDLDKVRAYRFDGTAGFTMKLGTWHEFPFAIEDEADIVVILRREATQSLLDTDPATGEVRGPDIQKQDLIKQHGVKLRFDV